LIDKLEKIKASIRAKVEHPSRMINFRSASTHKDIIH
jgi:hypothetical protein